MIYVADFIGGNAFSASCFLRPTVETALEDMAGSRFHQPLKGNMASGRPIIYQGPLGI